MIFFSVDDLSPRQARSSAISYSPWMLKKKLRLDAVFQIPFLVVDRILVLLRYFCFLDQQGNKISQKNKTIHIK